MNDRRTLSMTLRRSRRPTRRRPGPGVSGHPQSRPGPSPSSVLFATDGPSLPAGVVQLRLIPAARAIARRLSRPDRNGASTCRITQDAINQSSSRSEVLVIADVQKAVFPSLGRLPTRKSEHRCKLTLVAECTFQYTQVGLRVCDQFTNLHT